MKTAATSDATATKLQGKERELQGTVQRLKEVETLSAEIKSSLEREKTLIVQLQGEKNSATLNHSKVSKVDYSGLPSSVS